MSVNDGRDCSCPRCGRGQYGLSDLRLDDGEEAELDCECGHVFRVRCSVYIDYDVLEEEACDD